MNRYDRVLMVVSIIFRRFVNAAHGKIMVFFENFLSYVEIRKEIIYNLFDTDFH